MKATPVRDTTASSSSSSSILRVFFFFIFHGSIRAAPTPPPLIYFCPEWIVWHCRRNVSIQLTCCQNGASGATLESGKSAPAILDWYGFYSVKGAEIGVRKAFWLLSVYELQRIFFGVWLLSYCTVAWGCNLRLQSQNTVSGVWDEGVTGGGGLGKKWLRLNVERMEKGSTVDES